VDANNRAETTPSCRGSNSIVRLVSASGYDPNCRLTQGLERSGRAAANPLEGTTSWAVVPKRIQARVGIHARSS